MRPAPSLTAEGIAAADMLLAQVGNMKMPTPGEEIAARAGAAYALIAMNTNQRLCQLPDLPDGERSLHYFRAVGGGMGLTLKIVPEHERTQVAVGLFFYMLDFLSHVAGADPDEFITEFLELLEQTLERIEGQR